MRPQPGNAAHRYFQLRREVRRHTSDGWLPPSNLSTTPVCSSFPRAEFAPGGTHIDPDPATEDRLSVWNSRPRPGGGEELLEETFIDRDERKGWFGSKRRVLHCYQLLLGVPGSVFLDAGLASIDLCTGEVLRLLDGEEAARTANKLGLSYEQDPRQHNPGYNGPPPAPPVLPPQEPTDEVRREVNALVEALEPAGTPRIEVTDEKVVVGGVELDRKPEADGPAGGGGTCPT
ncbi:MAG: hypothetical protein HY319_23975 [Armatimonadetes bacterium]|nr:hypothetical protein [Armatimonadota bacterium]